MENETYSEMVTRLKKPGADILKDMDAFKANLVHMVLGVIGEYGEVERAYRAWQNNYKGTSVSKSILAAALIKELGDLEFYLEGLRQILRANAFYFKTQEPKGINNLAEIAKKVLATNKPVDKGIICAEIEVIDQYMLDIRSDLGITLEDVLKVNMNKLNDRFGSGQYSDKQAIERADEYE